MKDYVLKISNPPASPFIKGGVTKEFISKTTFLSFHGLEAVSQCHSEASAEESQSYKALIQ
jgi:hypothetical protein